MKKITLVLTVLVMVLIVALPRSIPVQATSSDRSLDVYGSHDLSVYPRPANTSIASFQCGGNTLNIVYLFSGSNQNASVYQKTFLDALPKYQWVIDASSPTIAATPNPQLADSGLKGINISFGSDDITVKLTKTGDYVSNECLFYWSKFYLN